MGMQDILINSETVCLWLVNRNYDRAVCAVNRNYDLRCLYCLFVSSLSSCHEKATVALYFERIRTRFGVVHLTSYHLISCMFEATKQR